MPLVRRFRHLLAWLVAACVVFAHTAALAAGCAIELSRGGSEAFASQPCPAHSQPGSAAPGTANVCEVHCQAASLPLDAALHVPVALTSTVVIPLRVVAVLAPTFQAALPRGKPPPVLLKTSRLLI